MGNASQSDSDDSMGDEASDINALLMGETMEKGTMVLKKYAQTHPRYKEAYLANNTHKDIRKNRIQVVLDSEGLIIEVRPW
jgi:uridylate kinase